MEAMTGVCKKCGPSESPADPRWQSSCVRCGRMLTPKVSELHRAGGLDYGHHPWLDTVRDEELERRFTRESARLVGMDAESLIAYSEQRTQPGPLRNAASRHWPREAREEAADMRNYLCWEAQRILASGESERLPRLGNALAHILMAWHELDEYESPKE